MSTDVELWLMALFSVVALWGMLILTLFASLYFYGKWSDLRRAPPRPMPQCSTSLVRPPQ